MAYLHSPSEAEITAKNIIELLGTLSNSLEGKKAEWDKALKEMGNYQAGNNTFSDVSYSILKELLEQYAKTKDPTPLFTFFTDKANVYLLCSSLDNPRIYEPPLTNNRELLAQLLNDIVIVQYYDDEIIPLLQTYLRYENGIDLLKSYIAKIFTEKTDFSDDLANEIKNKQRLYLDRAYALQQIVSTTNDTFEDTFQATGIAEVFLAKQYTFFDSMFFDWIISRKNYSLAVIEKNTERIKACTVDEQKVISAFVIVNLINRNTEESLNTVSAYIEKMGISFANIESYWNLNNAKLKEKYGSIIQEAKIAIRTFFTKDFIHIVFDYLYGSQRYDLDKTRLLFWLQYAKQIKRFRLFINEFGKAGFIQFLSRRKNGSLFRKYLDDFLVLDRNGKYENQPENIAMIFDFGELIIAEFPKSGHPVQVFQSTNIKASHLFRSHYSEIGTVWFYKDNEEGRYVEVTAKYNHPGEGSIAHRGDWLSKIDSILNGYGIIKDMLDNS